MAGWFEVDDDVPFMMQVYPIREEKRALIPAVTHVDGSGRLQAVYRETNPRHYRLIEEFEALSGVPAQHLVQRERAGRVQAGGGAGLLSAHEDGCAGDGGLARFACCIERCGEVGKVRSFALLRMTSTTTATARAPSA